MRCANENPRLDPPVEFIELEISSGGGVLACGWEGPGYCLNVSFH
jgi:hypothetical protein